MTLLPPRLSGLVSVCSRWVAFANALPEAKIELLRVHTAGGREVIGSVAATRTAGAVPLDSGADLVAGDILSVRQTFNAEVSVDQREQFIVQGGTEKFNAPVLASRFLSCARGVILTGVQPGATVELVGDNNAVLGTGYAISGTAHLHASTSAGFPPSDKPKLVVRQRLCSNPPPPGGAPEWVIDHPMPPLDPFPYPEQLPAPTVTGGLDACSKALTLSGVLPGTDVIVEDYHRRWWATSGPSDHTDVVVVLPVPLEEGGAVEIRQEAGCRTTPMPTVLTVGPKVPPPSPILAAIACSATPAVFVTGLIPEATVEIEVTAAGGLAESYVSSATVSGRGDPVPVPAPELPQVGTVRLRQAVCPGEWGPWSSVQPVAPAPVLKAPGLIGGLFNCQHEIRLSPLESLAGVIRVMSEKRNGPVGQALVDRANMTISVTPSLDAGDAITIVHSACGQEQHSGPHHVQHMPPEMRPLLRTPILSWSPEVIIDDVPSGSHLELWLDDELCVAGTAPHSTTPTTTAHLALPPGVQLVYGHIVQVRTRYCGRYWKTPKYRVYDPKPEVGSIQPSSLLVGTAGFGFVIRGRGFRPSGKQNLTVVSNAGTEVYEAQVISDGEIATASIDEKHFATEGSVRLTVTNNPNPDGSTNRSNGRAVHVVSPTKPDEPKLVRPTIEVTQKGSKTETVYTVSGYGFLPSTLINVRVVAPAGGNLVPAFRKAHSDNNGNLHPTSTDAFDTTQLVPESFGRAHLNFSAADNRLDPTSTPKNEPLWSNTVTFYY